MEFSVRQAVRFLLRVGPPVAQGVILNETLSRHRSVLTRSSVVQ